MRQRCVAINLSSPGESGAEKERIRTLLQLAIAIGRREGLISSGIPAECDCVNDSGESYASALKSTSVKDS